MFYALNKVEDIDVFCAQSSFGISFMFYDPQYEGLVLKTKLYILRKSDIQELKTNSSDKYIVVDIWTLPDEKIEYSTWKEEKLERVMSAREFSTWRKDKLDEIYFNEEELKELLHWERGALIELNMTQTEVMDSKGVLNSMNEFREANGSLETLQTPYKDVLPQPIVNALTTYLHE